MWQAVPTADGLKRAITFLKRWRKIRGRLCDASGRGVSIESYATVGSYTYIINWYLPICTCQAKFSIIVSLSKICCIFTIIFICRLISHLIIMSYVLQINTLEERKISCIRKLGLQPDHYPCIQSDNIHRVVSLLQIQVSKLICTYVAHRPYTYVYYFIDFRPADWLMWVVLAASLHQQL